MIDFTTLELTSLKEKLTNEEKLSMILSNNISVSERDFYVFTTTAIILSILKNVKLI